MHCPGQKSLPLRGILNTLYLYIDISKWNDNCMDRYVMWCSIYKLYLNIIVTLLSYLTIKYGSCDAWNLDSQSKSHTDWYNTFNICKLIGIHRVCMGLCSYIVQWILITLHCMLYYVWCPLMHALRFNISDIYNLNES